MSSIFEKALDKIDSEEEHERTARPAPAPRRVEVDEPTRVSRAEPAPPPDADPYPAPPPPRVSERPVESEPVVTAPAEPPVATPPPPAAPSGNANAATATAPPDAGARTANYAEIDLDAIVEAGLVSPASAETTLAEQHRMIKRPLLMKAFPPGGKRLGNENVILVTSSLPNEGKTFVAINLAMSIAMEVERTVLLVDGDPAKGNITRVLGINAERGLTDYLMSDDLQLPDVLVRTNVEKLTVLPAGPLVSNVTELFSSDQMKRLTDELASRYSDRVIIIDSAPLLAAASTRVLAGLAGQIVFVVEAVRTTQSAVREALHMIESHPNIGLVLNKSRERPRSSYHYGYYGAKA